MLSVASGQLVSSVKTEWFAASAGQCMTPCCAGISAMTRRAGASQGRNSGTAKPKPATSLPVISGQQVWQWSRNAFCAARPSDVV